MSIGEVQKEQLRKQQGNCIATEKKTPIVIHSSILFITA